MAQQKRLSQNCMSKDLQHQNATLRMNAGTLDTRSEDKPAKEHTDSIHKDGADH